MLHPTVCVVFGFDVRVDLTRFAFPSPDPARPDENTALGLRGKRRFFFSFTAPLTLGHTSLSPPPARRHRISDRFRRTFRTFLAPTRMRRYGSACATTSPTTRRNLHDRRPAQKSDRSPGMRSPTFATTATSYCYACAPGVPGQTSKQYSATCHRQARRDTTESLEWCGRLRPCVCLDPTEETFRRHIEIRLGRNYSCLFISPPFFRRETIISIGGTFSSNATVENPKSGDKARFSLPRSTVGSTAVSKLFGSRSNP